MDWLTKYIPGYHKDAPDVTKTPQAQALQNYGNQLASATPAGNPAGTLQEGAASPQQLAQAQAVSDGIDQQIEALFAKYRGKNQDQAFKDQYQALQDQKGNAQNRLKQLQSDTQGNIDPAAKAAQTQALQMELDAAAGKAPSAAEQLLRQQTDQNMRDQLNLAATTQGSNPGMSQRAGLAGAADVNSRASANAAALRANEIATAREAAAGTATNQRGQNIGIAQSNQATDVNKTTQALAGLGANTNLATQNVTNQLQNQAANDTTIGHIYSGVGQGAAAASDETLKKNIKDGDSAADSFLSQLHKPKTFEWKDPTNPLYGGPGKELGIIAQDLAKKNTATGPDGKRWISADVIGQVLAGLGRLDEKVEAKGKK